MSNWKPPRGNPERYSDGYERLRAEWSTTHDPHDPWGSNSAWLYAICHVLYHENGDDYEPIPDHWEYRHGGDWNRDECPSYNTPDPEQNTPEFLGTAEDWETAAIQDLWRHGDITNQDLTQFGETLNRYDNLCRSLGKNY